MGKRKGKYAAGFKQNGKETSVLFTPSGVLTETEVSIETSALLPAVSGYRSQKYNGKKVKEAAIITKVDGTVNYEAALKRMDIIFSADGSFLTVVKH